MTSQTHGSADEIIDVSHAIGAGTETEAARRLIVSHAPAIVGIDSVNIDHMADGRRIRCCSLQAFRSVST
jgi:hypothetical protein